MGAIAIGRNEGARLKDCLRSLAQVPIRVYADSDSSDGSAAWAESQGAIVVRLTAPPALTAARGRNAGLAALLATAPDTEFVQMIDGDCELAPGWLEAGLAALRGDDTLAAVFGRLRERDLGTLYNRMCEVEWSGPLGEVPACGGIALFRVAALRASGGYAEGMIGGEEPDLCLRIRQRGWRIVRIGADMAIHDAGITAFGQWWRRTARSGRAFAELDRRHGRSGEPRWRRQLASIAVWAGLVPLLLLATLVAAAAAGAAWPLLGAAAVLLLYPVQIGRIASRRTDVPRGEALSQAGMLVLGKFAQLSGMLRYWLSRASR